MLRPLLPLVVSAVFAASAQQYTGPKPPKPDLPYLKHADQLIATEAATAKEEKKKDSSVYTIDGAGSPARTPLASPVFIFQSDRISPESLQLFRLETKGGHREITMSKRGPEPIRMEVTRLNASNLYKMEVYNDLEAGEYSLSPANSNVAFCFAVF